MIRNGAIAGMCITLFISLVLPVIICIVYSVKNKGKGLWKFWFLGAAGFFVPQMLIRMPLLQTMSVKPGFLSFTEDHPVIYLLLLAFTAGLFEMAGRTAVAFSMKKHMTFEKSVAAGLGHGGIEAILIVGITYLNNLLFSFLINSGGFDSLVSQAPDELTASGLLQMKTLLVETDGILYYLAGYERILTMILHVALTVIISYAVWKGKTVWGMLICLAVHFLADFLTVLINSLATPQFHCMISQTAAYVSAYAVLTAVAVLCAVVILKIKKKFQTS